MKQDDFNKIDSYIKGEVNYEKKKQLESLFLDGENNLYFRNCLEKDWELMLRDSSPSGVDLNHLLDRIHHLIRRNETLKRQKPLQKFFRIYMKAAAILLLPILVAGGLVCGFLGNHVMIITRQQVNSTIYSPQGARVSFNLPDGTTGMLNSGSYLSYSLPFINNRQIKLEGEAWFEVYHDEDHPFEINIGNSTVKVLGTSFNVSAYPAENYVEVVLQQGKLEFLDNKVDKKVTIFPSERLVSQNGIISKSLTNPAKYNAWTEGKLVFRCDPMDEVIRRIERWYNVKIEVASKEIEKYSFHATFQDDKLEDVLKFLTMTSPIEYTISPRELMPDGTIVKEKVTLYAKNR